MSLNGFIPSGVVTPSVWNRLRADWYFESNQTAVVYVKLRLELSRANLKTILALLNKSANTGFWDLPELVERQVEYAVVLSRHRAGKNKPTGLLSPHGGSSRNWSLLEPAVPQQDYPADPHLPVARTVHPLCQTFS